MKNQGLNSPERLNVHADKNIDDICNVMKKPGCKNANKMHNRGQQVSVKAKENLKLAIFLFHYRWRNTFVWKVMGVCNVLVGQKRLKAEYKDPSVLPKVNKADMGCYTYTQTRMYCTMSKV